MLVITSAGIYPIEIKNYNGLFEIRENQCFVNGKKVGYNPITQSQKVLTNISHILHPANQSLKIQGALVFAGQHNDILIHDSTPSIKILTANQLRQYIWQIANDERNHYGPPIDKAQIIQQLEQFETTNPFMDFTISDEVKHRVRKGICCSHCGSFNVDTSKSYINCSCGMYEAWEIAVVRTICEYGVIHFQDDLRTSELWEFLGGQVSRTSLVKILNKYFTKIGNNRGSRYTNLRLPFERVYNRFDLNKSRFLELREY